MTGCKGFSEDSAIRLRVAHYRREGITSGHSDKFLLILAQTALDAVFDHVRKQLGGCWSGLSSAENFQQHWMISLRGHSVGSTGRFPR